MAKRTKKHELGDEPLIVRTDPPARMIPAPAVDLRGVPHEPVAEKPVVAVLRCRKCGCRDIRETDDGFQCRHCGTPKSKREMERYRG